MVLLTQRTPTPDHRSAKGLLEEKAMKKEY